MPPKHNPDGDVGSSDAIAKPLPTRCFASHGEPSTASGSDSKSGGRKSVRIRVPPPVLFSLLFHGAPGGGRLPVLGSFYCGEEATA